MSKKCFIGAFVALFVSAPTFGQGAASQMLLDSFGNRCTTSGAHNYQALQQSAKIGDTLKAMLAANDCKGLSAAYQRFQGAMGDFQLNARASAIAETKGYVNDLAGALASERARGIDADPTYILALQNDLNTKRLALFQAQQSEDIKNSPLQYSALSGAYTYSKELLYQLSISQTCVNKQPNLAAEITAQALAFTAQYSSGVLSGGLLAGALILDHAIVFARDYKLGKAMKDLDKSRLAEGVGCAYEQVTRNWCQARDYINLVKGSTEAKICTECEKHDAGLSILNTDLEPFSQWAQRLNAGSPAGTPGQVSDKQRAFDMDARFNSLITNLEGKVSIGEHDIQDSENPTLEREALLKKLILALQMEASTESGSMNGMNYERIGIAAGLFPRDSECGPAAYLYSNGEVRECVRSNGDSCQSCISNKYPTAPELPQLRTTIAKLKTELSAVVNKEKTKYLENDCKLALSKIDALGAKNSTARDFLMNTKTYFDARLADNGSVLASRAPLRDAVVDANEKIQQSLDILAGPEQCEKKIHQAAEHLSPQNNVFFISDKLNELVRQEFAHSFSKGQAGGDIEAMAAHSVREVVEQIISQYGNNISAQAQAEAAQRQAVATMKSLDDVFGNDLDDEIEGLSKTSPGGILHGIQCFRKLSATDSKFKKFKNACKNAELKFLDGDKEVKISFKNLPPEKEKQRCLLYDYLRHSEVSQRKKAK